MENGQPAADPAPLMALLRTPALELLREARLLLMDIRAAQECPLYRYYQVNQMIREISTLLPPEPEPVPLIFHHLEIGARAYNCIRNRFNSHNVPIPEVLKLEQPHKIANLGIATWLEICDQFRRNQIRYTKSRFYCTAPQSWQDRDYPPPQEE